MCVDCVLSNCGEPSALITLRWSGCGFTLFPFHALSRCQPLSFTLISAYTPAPLTQNSHNHVLGIPRSPISPLCNMGPPHLPCSFEARQSVSFTLACGVNIKWRVMHMQIKLWQPASISSVPWLVYNPSFRCRTQASLLEPSHSSRHIKHPIYI